MWKRILALAFAGVLVTSTVFSHPTKYKKTVVPYEIMREFNRILSEEGYTARCLTGKEEKEGYVITGILDIKPFSKDEREVNILCPWGTFGAWHTHPDKRV